VQTPDKLLEQWLAEADGLIFDCDGTLVDTMPSHYHAWSTVLASYGCTFPESDFYHLGGMPMAKIVARLNEEQGLSIPVQAAVAKKVDFYLAHSPTLQPIGPVAAIARRFHGKKPIAVASGGSRQLVSHSLASAGLTSLFEVVVTSEDVEHGKPAPDTYHLAAERLGLQARNCLVFEDAPTGIASAEAARARCVEVGVVAKEGEREFHLRPRAD